MTAGVRCRARPLRAATSMLCVAALAPIAPTQSPDDVLFRRLDGVDPLRPDPQTGAAHELLLRLAPAAYADGTSAPAGATRPSARAISQVVCSQDGDLTTTHPITDFVWQWGQFLDHDIDLSDAADPAEFFPVAVPLGDPHFDPFGTGTATIDLNRSAWQLDVAGVRQQINSITAWIDASNVYGSDAGRAAALRDVGGYLLTSAGALLPSNDAGLPNAPTAHDPSYFLAGDVRANENVGLTALHTLFVREHNLWVATLRPLGFDGETAYEVARLLVGAEMQAITYNEFLPVVLGRDALPPYRGYRPELDARIANEFSTAAYRFGHTMLSPQLRRLDASLITIAAGDLALRDAFFAPDELRAHGIEPILRGLANQRPQRVDTRIVDDVRNFLFGPPGSGGFDLASLNIQRGRDHGLPSYVELRDALGLPRVREFADVTRDAETRARLEAVYGSVDAVDAWVGGLAEDPARGALVGPTIRAVLTDQFRRLRDADRFWYQRHLPPAWVRFIENRRLATIIRANTTIDRELPDDVFHEAGAQPNRQLGPRDRGRGRRNAQPAR